MKNQAVRAVQLWLVCMFFLAAGTNAQVSLIAKGTLTTSRAGFYHDLSGLHETLENGAAADSLGGLGSGMTWVSGNTFLAVPDRGPNAIPFNPGIDDTVSYINRFHTITMELKENHGAGLPFTITPRLEDTTLLHSLLPLAYGSGKDFDVPPGAPKENNLLRHFFTGRSDNFTPKQNSGFPFDGRFDPESIRVSRDEQRCSFQTNTVRTSINFCERTASGCARLRYPTSFTFKRRTRPRPANRTAIRPAACRTKEWKDWRLLRTDGGWWESCRMH